MLTTILVSGTGISNPQETIDTLSYSRLCPVVVEWNVEEGMWRNVEMGCMRTGMWIGLCGTSPDGRGFGCCSMAPWHGVQVVIHTPRSGLLEWNTIIPVSGS